jgi:uncharacterized protein (DUF433 family)
MAHELIVSDPSVMMGRVESILQKLAPGETVEQLLESHPRLTRQGVRAALRFGQPSGAHHQ